MAIARLAQHHLVTPLRFFRVVGELGFHYMAVERVLLVEKVDALERKPCAVVAAGPYRSP
jgi:hypothetical protein